MPNKEGDLPTSHRSTNGKDPDQNIIDRITVLADPYIRHIKYGFYAIGTVGVILILRSVHTGKVITSARDVPIEFIKKNVKLQGVVKSVDQYGVLYISHIPIIQKPKWINETPSSPVPVKLACIDVSLDGCMWLHKNLLNKKVWFQVLSVPPTSTEQIIGAVYKRQYLLFPKKCINKELVRLGLSRVSNSSLDKTMESSDFHHKLLLDLVKLENTATKKNIGVWAKKSSPETKVNKAGQFLKGIILAPIELVKISARFIKKLFGR